MTNEMGIPPMKCSECGSFTNVIVIEGNRIRRCRRCFMGSGPVPKFVRADRLKAK